MRPEQKCGLSAHDDDVKCRINALLELESHIIRVAINSSCLLNALLHKIHHVVIMIDKIDEVQSLTKI